MPAAYAGSPAYPTSLPAGSAQCRPRRRSAGPATAAATAARTPSATATPMTARAHREQRGQRAQCAELNEHRATQLAPGAQRAQHRAVVAALARRGLQCGQQHQHAGQQAEYHHQLHRLRDPPSHRAPARSPRPRPATGWAVRAPARPAQPRCRPADGTPTAGCAGCRPPHWDSAARRSSAGRSALRTLVTVNSRSCSPTEMVMRSPGYAVALGPADFNRRLRRRAVGRPEGAVHQRVGRREAPAVQRPVLVVVIALGFA